VRADHEPERPASPELLLLRTAVGRTNGYASGMVATTWLNRFRAYGVICGRFVRGRWYRFPPRAVAEIRRLTADMQPLRVSAPPPSC
jgi:hypothetical protein